MSPAILIALVHGFIVYKERRKGEKESKTKYCDYTFYEDYGGILWVIIISAIMCNHVFIVRTLAIFNSKSKKR